MALELELPKCVYAHSFWIAEGKKMSKSLGNFIDLDRIQGFIDHYGADMWRHYLTTQGPLGAALEDRRRVALQDAVAAPRVGRVAREQADGILGVADEGDLQGAARGVLHRVLQDRRRV